jgi:hypothetical protein
MQKGAAVAAPRAVVHQLCQRLAVARRGEKGWSETTAGFLRTRVYGSQGVYLHWVYCLVGVLKGALYVCSFRASVLTTMIDDGRRCTCGQVPFSCQIRVTA